MLNSARMGTFEGGLLLHLKVMRGWNVLYFHLGGLYFDNLMFAYQNVYDIFIILVSRT
jgi:hypothetical protein